MDLTFKCLCCRDTGIIPGILLKRYVDRYKDYGDQLNPPAAVLCSRCDGIYQRYQTSSGIQVMPRLPLNHLDQGVTLKESQLIHTSELARAAEAPDLPTAAERIRLINQMMRPIGNGLKPNNQASAITSAQRTAALAQFAAGEES